MNTLHIRRDTLYERAKYTDVVPTASMKFPANKAIKQQGVKVIYEGNKFTC